MGCRLPPAISPATVAEPSVTRTAEAMSQPRNRGDRLDPANESAMTLPTPESISTCLNAPPPAMMSRMPATAPTDSSDHFINCFMPTPRRVPSAHSANNTARSTATIESPKNLKYFSAGESAGRVSSAAVAVAMSSTGTSAASRLMPKPGISASEKSRDSNRPFGGLAMRLRWNSGKMMPVTNMAGMATMVPYSSVRPMLAPNRAAMAVGPGWGGKYPCVMLSDEASARAR